MRKLVVVNSELDEGLRAQIRDAAAGHGFTVRFFEKNADALADAADAEVIFGMGRKLAKAAGSSLKWFCSASAGVEHYCSEDAFASKDVILTNSSGTFGLTIAEHIIMVTLMLLRRMPAYEEIMRMRRWDRGLPIRSIHGSRITILGTGNLGSEAARRFAAFGPECITGLNRSGKNPGAGFDQVYTIDHLDEILPQTDILVMTLPGTAETDQLMDAGRLARMKETAVLINVGRGNSVDQKALAALLKEGRLAGAALDVFETEPVPPEDPLWETPGLLMTPHVSGNLSLRWTVEENVRLFLENFENYAEGRPMLRLVDRKRGY